MAERKYGARAAATDTTVAGADWSGRAIADQSHTRVLFVDLDMTEAEVQGATFEECTFRRGRFNASVHTDSAFINCTFSGCAFFDARFIDCKFVGSMFDRCTYEIMQVAGGNWSFVGMSGADLRSAAFRNVRMCEADLTGACCAGSSIRDVDLSRAWLHSADLSGCDLRGSDLSTLEPENVKLRGAIITIDQTIVIAEALGLEVRLE